MTSAVTRRRWSVLVSWLALGLSVVTLQAAGRVLPAPTLGAPSQWSHWMAGRDPVVVAFVVVRVLALGAAWYGLAVTAVGVALRLASARHLAVRFDRLTVMPLRGLVAATVTVGVSVSPMSATVAGASTTAAHSPATVTMHRLGPGETARPTTSSAPLSAPDAAAGPSTATATETAWTVRPGECFWSIAETHLGRAWGRGPSSAEIVPYWQRLVEANRGVLADPRNPDLVFPGQVFSLPPL